MVDLLSFSLSPWQSPEVVFFATGQWPETEGINHQISQRIAARHIIYRASNIKYCSIFSITLYVWPYNDSPCTFVR